MIMKQLPIAHQQRWVGSITVLLLKQPLLSMEEVRGLLLEEELLLLLPQNQLALLLLVLLDKLHFELKEHLLLLLEQSILVPRLRGSNKAGRCEGGSPSRIVWKR
jgi:hypothetical protein